MAEPQDRATLILNVRATTKATIDRMKEDMGVSISEISGRLVDWFVAQPRTVRREILDRDGDAAGELVRLKLMQAAATKDGLDLPGAMDAQTSIDVMRTLLARLESVTKAYELELKSRSGKKK